MLLTGAVLGLVIGLLAGGRLDALLYVRLRYLALLVGALILATISNGLTIKGIDPYWGVGVTGVLLLGSLGLEKWIAGTVSRRLVSTAQASVHTGKR